MRTDAPHRDPAGLFSIEILTEHCVNRSRTVCKLDIRTSHCGVLRKSFRSLSSRTRRGGARHTHPLPGRRAWSDPARCPLAWLLIQKWKFLAATHGACVHTFLTSCSRRQSCQQALVLAPPNQLPARASAARGHLPGDHTQLSVCLSVCLHP